MNQVKMIGNKVRNNQKQSPKEKAKVKIHQSQFLKVGPKVKNLIIEKVLLFKVFNRHKKVEIIKDKIKLIDLIVIAVTIV